jgi:hypothetical protein
MDQGSRLQGMLRALTTHVAASQLSELCVDDWKKLTGGFFIAIRPAPKKTGHILA